LNTGCIRRVAVVLLACLLVAACSSDTPPAAPYGAAQAKVGETQAILGWNLSVANLRFDADHVLIDIDGAPADPSAPRAAGADLRFGLYGALAHPIEATGLGSCDQVPGPQITPLTATPDRLTGTVCLGPLNDQAQVRGVYVYSPRDRIAGSTVAYPAAFPVGLPATNPNDSGVTVTSTSAEAWRADGTQLSAESLGEQAAFTGNGYMLLGLRADAVAAEYRDRTAALGGPLMLLVAPTLPPPGLNPACSAYGSSVLLLPEATLDAVSVNASLCTQGDINAALLYATVSIVGTHAAVWLTEKS